MHKNTSQNSSSRKRERLLAVNPENRNEVINVCHLLQKYKEMATSLDNNCKRRTLEIQPNYNNNITIESEDRKFSNVEDDALLHKSCEVTPKWSQFYLERVGFEAKVNMRRRLKIGTNIIGRSDVKNIDIGVDSLFCSRRHCVIGVIGVCNSSVFVTNLNASNSTTVNGIKQKLGGTMDLQEGDTVGIVGGTNPMCNLIGNSNFTVYRLSKYTDKNLETYEIDDHEPIELSDDEV